MTNDSFVFSLLAVFVSGCATTEDETEEVVPPVDTAENDWMTLGEVHGHVTRPSSMELSGDGVGNITIMAYFGGTGEFEVGVDKILIITMANLSDPNTEYPYELTNLFPEPEPYHLNAFFDEDDNHFPSNGDLFSEMIPVLISSGDVLEIDLELSIMVDDSTAPE